MKALQRRHCPAVMELVQRDWKVAGSTSETDNSYFVFFTNRSHVSYLEGDPHIVEAT